MENTNPALAVESAIQRSLELAETWIAWDGSPIVTDGVNLWTPHKAARRLQDHLLDHLAEVEALLAGVPTIPDEWLGRVHTFDSDWAHFTETDLREMRSRLTRLAQIYLLRYEAAGPGAWDAPREPHWTLRRIAEHVGSSWYAEQVGSLATFVPR